MQPTDRTQLSAQLDDMRHVTNLVKAGCVLVGMYYFADIASQRFAVRTVL